MKNSTENCIKIIGLLVACIVNVNFIHNYDVYSMPMIIIIPFIVGLALIQAGLLVVVVFIFNKLYNFYKEMTEGETILECKTIPVIRMW